MLKNSVVCILLGIVYFNCTILSEDSLAKALPPSTVSDILGELEDLPLEDMVSDSSDDDVSPELMELYHDVELLLEMQNSNLTDTRDGRGLLSKLSFLTGLKLGGFLSASGTLAASQSINFLGKVLNAALSISYGNIGGYPGLYGGGITQPIIGEPIVGSPILGQPIVGLQKLPVIEEDLPPDDKKREKPDGVSTVVASNVSGTSADIATTPDAAKKEFIKTHNKRVEYFNNAFDKKVRTRTGRLPQLKIEQGT